MGEEQRKELGQHLHFPAQGENPPIFPNLDHEFQSLNAFFSVSPHNHYNRGGFSLGMFHHSTRMRADMPLSIQMEVMQTSNSQFFPKTVRNKWLLQQCGVQGLNILT